MGLLDSDCFDLIYGCSGEEYHRGCMGVTRSCRGGADIQYESRNLVQAAHSEVCLAAAKSLVYLCLRLADGVLGCTWQVLFHAIYFFVFSNWLLIVPRMEYIHQMQEELATRMQADAQEYCRDSSVLREPRKSSLLKGMVLVLPNAAMAAIRDSSDGHAAAQAASVAVMKQGWKPPLSISLFVP